MPTACRISPRADAEWQIRSERFDPAARLENALEKNRVEASLRELTPENPQYQALRRMLAEYRGQEAKGGWPGVPANLRLAPGQRSRAVALVARRLSASGDYTGPVVDDSAPRATPPISRTR